ncbi:MAG: GH1 family beta-glucosidase [Myxococcota bacterium]
MLTKPFPTDFLWGVATSSYQIEGGATADGRLPSIWDTFCLTPGAIEDGSSGDVACDHYGRWREDVGLLAKGLGVGAYRFSLAWPRIIPTGTGAVNAAGLDFYDRLVDALLEAGVAPCPTLYHWDLPQPLEDAGGWPLRDTVEAFERYADVVAARLGDRVSSWVTINEPWCAAWLGYAEGAHAPGRRSPSDALAAIHHLLLAHGRAAQRIAAHVTNPDIGIAQLYVHPMAASSSAADADATRKLDGFFNRWFLDPLYRGAYPEDVIADHVRDGHLTEPELPFVAPGDLACIATPTTTLAVNYYSRAIVRSEAVAEGDNAPREIPEPTADVKTDMDWEVYPDGLRAALMRVHRDYAPVRLIVAENGCAYDTPPDSDGVVRDTRRVAYLRGHLEATRQAIEEGAPVQGYYLWSAFDNFEWAFGYAKRFGVIWVDFETGERTIKQSGHWYARVVADHGVEREES